MLNFSASQFFYNSFNNQHQKEKIMAISAKEVNELRQKTGAGLMDCKKALTETDGDIEAAIDLLRKKGAKVAELRAGRDANEGVVIAQTNSDGTKGVIVRLSCETDFVAKNQDFIDLAQSIADLALNNDIPDMDALMEAELDGVKIKDVVAEKVAAIGENISLSSYIYKTGEGLVPYIHAGYKIGVLVELNKAATNGVDEVGKTIAMQIAAMNPVAVDQEGVSQEIIDREMNIGREKAVAEGKPENIIDKIAEGSVKKFLKENTLLNQPFVKDNKKVVSQVLQETQDGLTVKSFDRVSLS